MVLELRLLTALSCNVHEAVVWNFTEGHFCVRVALVLHWRGSYVGLRHDSGGGGLRLFDFNFDFDFWFHWHLVLMSLLIA